MTRRAISRLSVLLTVSLGADFHLAASTCAKAAPSQQTTPLYLLDSTPHRVLHPLDPETLSDFPESLDITLGTRPPSDPYAWLLVSPDGTHLARVSYLGGNAVQGMAAKDSTVKVFDLPAGWRRATFHPQVAILAEGLSPETGTAAGSCAAKTRRRFSLLPPGASRETRSFSSSALERSLLAWPRFRVRWQSPRGGGARPRVRRWS